MTIFEEIIFEELVSEINDYLDEEVGILSSDSYWKVAEAFMDGLMSMYEEKGLFAVIQSMPDAAYYAVCQAHGVPA